MNIKSLIKEMRPTHYLKNIIILIPMFFGGKLFEFDLSILIKILSFCLLSSAVYIINDLFDYKNDIKHPIKKQRPIAAGELSKKAAIICSIVLIAISFAINIIFYDIKAIVLLVLYLLLNILYSFKLKEIPVLDICILVSGYLIRLIYGSVITGVVISNWLYLLILALSFFMVIGKRRNELLDKNLENTRPLKHKYPQGFLESSIYVFMALSIIFYALWAIDPNITNLYANYIYLLYSTIFVVFAIFLRYIFVIKGDSSGDPVDVILHDIPLLLLSALYAFIMFICIYIK